MEVYKVSGPAIDQSAIIKVQIPESLGGINRLVYDEGGKLHALHAGYKASLFDSLTKELIPLEAPQEGQVAVRSAISPNADYIAFLRYVGEGESGNISTKRL